MTDPTTGARSMVKDGDGRPVKTRLDGDLLRELATITSGAYIPAGTGLLDLESIFERHIAPLTRRNLESRERIIRRDIYQWPIALALAMMLIALTLNRRRAASNVIAAAGIALALTLSSVSEPSLAQAAQSSSIAPQASPPTPLRPVPAGEARAEPALPDNARSAYNDGVTSLATGNVERAGKVLEHARDIAGADAEVRFAATFNRGWVAVRQADDTLEEKPEEALAFLHEAARWFGDAVRLRPDELEPRQNLELVLRRALQLADQLADQKPSEIEGRLDALIAIQRGFIGTVANAVDAHDPKNAHADKRIRSLYRELALQAITILSDAGAASDDASRAADALTDEAVEDAEKALRKAGLEGVVAHLHKARERLSQGRARLRRAQGEGAFRRAAHALDSMQRARDQLRSPVERLDALIAALGELIQVTRLAQTEKRPSWASDGYLTNSNSSAKERADEVSKQFGSVTKTSPDAEQPEDEKTKQLRKNLLRAAPLVRQATEHLVQAEAALSRQALSVAHKHQSESFKELLKAREGFLDLRRLIEVVHRTETQVTNAVDGKVDEAELLHRAPAITALHANNIERMIRVGELISEEMTRQPEKDEEQANADGRAKHMEQGYSLWVKAQESMHAASTALGSLTQNRPQAKEHADAAMEGIETLQRHFFSLIEHLRETAEHQQRINDQTVELEGLVGTFDAAATRARTGPIGFTQTNNATRSEGIAQALNKQAEAQAKAPPSQPQPSAGGSISTAGSTTGSASAVSTPDQLKHAAALVTEGHSLMRESVALIETEPSPDLEGTRPKQDEALAKLLEAIAVLQPPEQNQNDQQQEQQSQQESQDEQEPQPGQQDNSSINQLLQGVRDRDAERRAYRAGQQSGREPVAKDW
ncbi:MAG: hypothetical protein HOI95_20135 [Chromatiales bacterium]|nr:hypothetical protein [Chromatiales bacterium]